MKTIFRMICLKKDNILGDMGMEISIQCDACENLDYNLSCRAFPDGIPEKIITGQFDHTKPYPGDHGIRFEPIKEK